MDAFYTSPQVAQELWEILYKFLNIKEENYFFLEPSAGDGVFSTLPTHCDAYDIEPHAENIQVADFLKLTPKRNDYITIGNPPFGKRATLAIEFFNHAALCSDVIAMIFPRQFQKWLTQKQLDPSFKLVYDKPLGTDVFIYEGKRPVGGIRCTFQIWVKENSNFDVFPNFRILSAPPISLPGEIDLWQHNGTEQSKATVEKPWEYATYRQGYKDYKKLFTHEKDYQFIKNQIETTSDQFFFMKPLTSTAREIVLRLDFQKLADKNTTVKGFGKADFCEFYLKTKQQLEEKEK